MKITNHKQKHVQSGFTLLEIVIVVAIIGVLLGAGLKVFDGIRGNADLTATKIKMNGVSTKLESYRSVAGTYPSQSQGLQALVTKPTSAPKPRNWRQQATSIPVDAWQQELVYKFPGSKNPRTFELISAGEDMKLGTDDDISSQDE